MRFTALSTIKIGADAVFPLRPVSGREMGLTAAGRCTAAGPAKRFGVAETVYARCGGCTACSSFEKSLGRQQGIVF